MSSAARTDISNQDQANVIYPHAELSNRALISNCTQSTYTFEHKINSINAVSLKDCRITIKAGLAGGLELDDCHNTELNIEDTVKSINVTRCFGIKFMISEAAETPILTTAHSETIAIQVEREGYWCKDILIPSRMQSRLVEGDDGLQLHTKPMQNL